MNLSEVKKTDVKRSKSSPPTNINKIVKVVKIHDGDTCDLVFIGNYGFQRFKCRLDGIDTPELKAGNSASKARDFLAWLCLGQDPDSFPKEAPPWTKDELQDRLNANQGLVFAEFDGLGGYGRPLVTLRKQQGSPKTFNTMLMDYGYASKYSR